MEQFSKQFNSLLHQKIEYLSIFIVAIIVFLIGVSLFLSVNISPKKITRKLIDVKIAYKNPFEKKVQYKNPFDEYQNPIDDLVFAQTP